MYSASAQVPLTTTTNTLRHGDILCKVEVPYVEAGERGEEVVWQFGEITDDSRNHLQAINSNGDTIAIYEEGRILHYIVRNDTLYNKGMQSRRAYRILTEERPALHYPFQYGDSITGTYLGDGMDEGHSYQVHGFGYTVADGEGMLTDGIDTLRHVTRLHLVDDYEMREGEADPVRIVEERHQWYCTGYRYAVMESVHTACYDGSELMPLNSVTYLYLPIMQRELAEDEVNETLLETLALLDASGGSGATSPGSVLSALTASLSPDGTSLTLDYDLLGDTPLAFYAYDLMGFILASVQYPSREAGTHQDLLTLSRRPIGNALMLRIQCCEQTLFMKVAVE